MSLLLAASIEYGGGGGSEVAFVESCLVGAEELESESVESAEDEL